MKGKLSNAKVIWLFLIGVLFLVLALGLQFLKHQPSYSKRTVSNGKVISNKDAASYKDLTTNNSLKAFNAYTKNAQQDPQANEHYSKSKIPRPLIIIVHKTGCSHCQTAEPTITRAVNEEVPKKTNLLTVNVVNGIPHWLETVKGLMDTEGKLHTPTILVTQLVPTRNHWEWVTLDRYTGTEPALIEHVLDIQRLSRSTKRYVDNVRDSTDTQSENEFVNPN